MFPFKSFSTRCSLGGLHWFGVKVALSIDRRLLLRRRIGGIHVVRRDGSCYGTDAGHGDLEELCVKFLEKREVKGGQINHVGTLIHVDSTVCGCEKYQLSSRYVINHGAQGY